MKTAEVKESRSPVRKASRPLIILSESGDIITYRLKPGNRRRSKNQRAILEELAKGPMTPADLSRALGKPHQGILGTLSRLRESELVITSWAAGQNAEGTRILRRVYALNPEICLIARPVPDFTVEDLKAEAEAAQMRGILHQRIWQARQKMGSRDLVKRSQGLQQLERLHEEIHAALKADIPYRIWRKYHPATS